MFKTVTSCYRCEAPNYRSSYTGIVKQGELVRFPSKMEPIGFKKLPDSEELRDVGVKVGGGLGDKIYMIPVIRNLKGSIGVEEEDFPLFRAVKDHIRLSVKEDINIAEFMHSEKTEITDDVAELLGVELKDRSMSIEMSSYEKRRADYKYPDPFILIVSSSYSGHRKIAIETLNNLERKINSLGFKVVKDYHNLTLRDKICCVYKARLVITVATSSLPMAAALNKNIIAVNSRECEFRTAYIDNVITCEEDELISHRYIGDLSEGYHGKK